MKRDWNLIRELLESIEENKVKIYWDGLNQEQQKAVLLHYELLEESRLISNYELQSDMDDSGKISYHPNFLPQEVNVPGIRLTMKGYDLLEVLRDDNLWSRIKAKAKGLGVKLTYEFIVQAIPFLYKSMF